MQGAKKMKTTLTNLWYGNLTPSSSDHIHAAEINRLTGYIDQHQKVLKSKLDDEGMKSLDKLQQCHDELVLNECENAFVQGFSLAVKLLSEVQN